MAIEPRRKTPRVGFQPRFTLMLLYVSALFVVYCFALAAPMLYRFFEIGSAPDSGPKEQALLVEAMREALQGRLWIALAAAAATTGLGIWVRALPGLRPPREPKASEAVGAGSADAVHGKTKQAKRAASRRRAKP